MLHITSYYKDDSFRKLKHGKNVKKLNEIISILINIVHGERRIMEYVGTGNKTNLGS